MSNPICSICQKECEKWKQVRIGERKTICLRCQREKAKLRYEISRKKIKR